MSRKLYDHSKNFYKFAFANNNYRIKIKVEEQNKVSQHVEKCDAS
jgi:hypothetical protein